MQINFATGLLSVSSMLLPLMDAKASAAAPLFHKVYCRNDGWSGESLQIDYWSSIHRFIVDAKIKGAPFRVLLNADSCSATSSTQPLVFKCIDDESSTVDQRRYTSVEFASDYSEQQNTYPPLQEHYPIWYQRVLSFTFSGGDFAVPETRRLIVNVNYNETTHGGYREYCTVDGSVVER